MRGADYLVIGRPVTRAPDPAAVLAQIADDIRQRHRESPDNDAKIA